MTILDVWPNVSGFEAVRIELVIEVATHQGPTNVDLIIFNELKHPIIELSLMTRRKMHKNDLNDVLKYQLGNHPKDTGSLLPFTCDLRSHTISPTRCTRRSQVKTILRQVSMSENGFYLSAIWLLYLCQRKQKH